MSDARTDGNGSPNAPPGTPSPTRAFLSRNLILVGLASLLTDMSSEMVYPILPLFLTATLGASPRVLGLIEGIVEATASLTRVMSGWISDVMGKRKPFAVGGYALSVLGKLSLYLAASWPLVLGGRVLDRFGKGIRTAPRDALLAESVPSDQRGRAFGFHKAMDTLGAVLGVICAYLLIRAGHSELRTVLVWSLAPAALAVVVLCFLRETGKGRHASSNRPRVRLSDAWHRAPSRLRLFYLIVFLFALGGSSNQFLLLRARGLGFSDADTILLYLVYNLTYLVFSYPAGKLSDRIGRAPLLIAGYFIYAVSYAGFALADHLPASGTSLWLLFALYGCYIGLTDGTEKALVSDMSPSDARATFLGLHATITALGLFPASLIAGWLYDSISPSSAFLFGSVCALVAGILAVVFLRRPTGRE
ncbi:MAG: MFS transporter [Phycisphaerales bacterium]|nr:MFS transporter [Phycisphaerales bacterium]